MTQDLYGVLGVESSASQSEIKSAYRGLARKFHPDKNPGDLEAEAIFKEAVEAYRILGDSDLRAEYDRDNGGATGDFTPSGDIFEDLFGNKTRREPRSEPRESRSAPRESRAEPPASERRPRPPRQESRPAPPRGRRNERGDDLRYTLDLSAEEAALGTEREIEVPREGRCDTCHGTGAESGTAPTICSRCKGVGTVREQEGFFDVSKRCSQCGGSGKLNPRNCGQCRGSGLIERDHRISVRVPAGVSSGTRLKLRGEGRTGSGGGERGDLYVVCEVAAHPFFEREDDDVLVELPVSFTQAMLGDHVEIPTLDGKMRMQIPGGSQSGRVFRLKGKGYPRKDGRGRGDQRVRIIVELPETLTSEQADLIRSFRDREDLESDAYPRQQDFAEMLRRFYRQ